MRLLERLRIEPQRVLMGRLMGASVHALSRACALARTTVRRWWRALRSRSPLFVFSLRSRFPEWGRVADGEALQKENGESCRYKLVAAVIQREGVNP